MNYHFDTVKEYSRILIFGNATRLSNAKLLWHKTFQPRELRLVVALRVVLFLAISITDTFKMINYIFIFCEADQIFSIH
jgi:hypothetical protein